MKEAGYAEGKNLVLDIAVKQNYDELRPIAKAHVEKKPDVIVAIGGSTTHCQRISGPTGLGLEVKDVAAVPLPTCNLGY